MTGYLCVVEVNREFLIFTDNFCQHYLEDITCGLLKFSNYSKVVFSILLALPLVVAADKAENIEKQINKSINQLRMTEQQKEAKAQKLVNSAKDFFVNGDYKQAINKYLGAVKIFKTIGVGENNVFKQKIEYCQEQIYQCYYYWAMDLVAKVESKSYGKDYAEAIRLCQEAAKMYPPCKAKMEEKIKKLTVLRDAASRRYDTSEG